MEWGTAQFVLGIIAITTAGGIFRTWLHAKHGLPLPGRGRRARREGREDNREVETLKSENARLVDRLEASEDRLAVLERIVTDKSYHLADEIEALREPRTADRSKAI